MSNTVIRVENLSKLYRLGEVGTGSLAHDVNRWWHRVRGKEDPYLKIGQINDRTKKLGRSSQLAVGSRQKEMGSGQERKGRRELAVGSRQSAVGSSQLAVGSGQKEMGRGELAVGSGQQATDDSQLTTDDSAKGGSGKLKADDSAQSAAGSANCKLPTDDYVFALKNVTFDVQQGEVLGIIGRNGAGKSTLLKILSRVTVQTTGRIRVKGRIASLLEVGTGFHPELTGRENVYLNGAILGMRKAEIRAKFDEIVDFSGCERYIDTPVKRYSSGMYVRLAFAVAAHLEPEILIVDEVLAVGDAEFQKKCLGKMKDVAGHGRTVLFVSHNMTAVSELCTKGIYMKNGLLELDSGVDKVISTYLSESMPALDYECCLENALRREGVGEQIRMTHVRLVGDSARIPFGSGLQIEMQARALTDLENVFFGAGVNQPGGARLFTVEAYEQKIPSVAKDQLVTIRVNIPETGLAPGIYTLSVGVNVGINLGVDYVSNALTFEVMPKHDEVFYGARANMGLRLRSEWEHSLGK